MQYEIKGDVMPSLEIRLQSGESIYTESGGMAWMSEGIEMSTNAKGGLGGMIGRALSGESLFLTTYTSQADNTVLTFTPESMGKILEVPLAAGHSMIAQKDSFMCAESSVSMEMHFRKKLGTGLFGGEGFILQKLTGPGTAFVEISGEVAEYTLQPGQRLKVDPGHIAMYEPSVSYDITTVKGLRNIFLSGEGLFLATLTGPGKVWLQTLTLYNLAMRVYAFMPKKDSNSGDGGDLAGKIIGGIIKNI
jgi:uncharacterized protein (TIGR00266 family)